MVKAGGYAKKPPCQIEPPIDFDIRTVFNEHNI